MSLSIQIFVGGPVDTNAYLVADEETKHAVVIDAPAAITAEIVDAVAKGGYTVDKIVITHGHWDHTVDTKALHDAFDAPVYTHPGVTDRIVNPEPASVPIPPAAVDVEINDGDTVTIGTHRFEVMHLPGHDPAHIALYGAADKLFFGGDVIFPNGHGNATIGGADQATMDRTIKRLLAIPGDVTIYPGHGLHTTFGAEQGWMKVVAARVPQP